MRSPPSPQHLTRSEISRKRASLPDSTSASLPASLVSDCRVGKAPSLPGAWPFLMTLIRPSCSTTNRRRLPSPACVICTGISSPVATGINLTRGVASSPSGSPDDAPNTLTSRQAIQLGLWTVRTRTSSMWRGGSIGTSKICPSSVWTLLNRLCSVRTPPEPFPSQTSCVVGPAGAWVTTSCILSTK